MNANQLRESFYWLKKLPEHDVRTYNLTFKLFKKARENHQQSLADQLAQVFENSSVQHREFLFYKVRYLIEIKEFTAAGQLYSQLPSDEIRDLPNHGSVKKFLMKYNLI